MDNHSHPDFSQSGPGEHTAKSAGVRRVNNMPMYIVGAAIAAFLVWFIGSAMIVLQSTRQM